MDAVSYKTISANEKIVKKEDEEKAEEPKE